MREALLDLREKHPGWGPQTLRREIAKDVRFAGLKVPRRARSAAYLKEQGKVRKYERREGLPEPHDRPVQRPHQGWEMDAQGVTMVAGLGQVSFINLLDVYSHACPNVRHARSQAYQQVLRRTFTCYGMPEQIRLDHGSALFTKGRRSNTPGQNVTIKPSPGKLLQARHFPISQRFNTVYKPACSASTTNTRLGL